jgi:hypothetical protein
MDDGLGWRDIKSVNYEQWAGRVGTLQVSISKSTNNMLEEITCEWQKKIPVE